MNLLGSLCPVLHFELGELGAFNIGSHVFGVQRVGFGEVFNGQPDRLVKFQLGDGEKVPGIVGLGVGVSPHP